jgi:hypothetical protein
MTKLSYPNTGQTNMHFLFLLEEHEVVLLNTVLLNNLSVSLESV